MCYNLCDLMLNKSKWKSPKYTSLIVVAHALNHEKLKEQFSYLCINNDTQLNDYELPVASKLLLDDWINVCVWYAFRCIINFRLDPIFDQKYLLCHAKLTYVYKRAPKNEFAIVWIVNLFKFITVLWYMTGECSAVYIA